MPNEKPFVEPNVNLFDDANGTDDVVDAVGADVLGTPKVKPPDPILEAVDERPSSFPFFPLSSYPGRIVSHAGHTVSSALFRIIQTAHFHEPLSTPNVSPHP